MSRSFSEGRSRLLQEAKQYAERFGWEVFPLRPGGKQPYPGSNGVYDATSNPALIEDSWASGSNLGLACGQVSGVVVLDIDKDHGGFASMAELEKQFGPLPGSVRSRTGSGGLHIYFRAPSTPMKNGVGLRPGIDFRTDGGYVVLPPSQTDGAYTWIRAPGEYKLELMPEWLATLAKPVGGDVPTNAEGKFPAGTRNSSLTSVAGKLRRIGLNKDAIVPALWEVNEEHCSPPLTLSEVESIAHSVCNYEPDEELIDPQDRQLVRLDWSDPPEPPTWFLEGVIAKGDVVLVLGEPEAQKSWLAMGMSVAVANEADQFLGMRLHADGPAVYVDEENHPSEVMRRMNKLGFNGAERLIYFAQQDVRLDLNPERLLSAIRDLQPSLVVLDSLVAFHAGDEQNNVGMRTLFKQSIVPMSRKIGATVLVLHHVTKDEKASSFARARGAGDLTAVVDLGLDVQKPDDGSYRLVKIFKPRHLVYRDHFHFRLEDTGSKAELVPLD